MFVKIICNGDWTSFWAALKYFCDWKVILFETNIVIREWNVSELKVILKSNKQRKAPTSRLKKTNKKD